MKKMFFAFMAVVIAASCSKTEPQLVPEEGGSSFTGEIIFVGGAPSTRVCMGDRTNDGDGWYYPGVWESSDSIDVVGTASGSVLGTAGYIGLDASGRGLFNYSGDAISAGTALRVVFPAGASMNIPAEQEQAAAGASSIGKYSYAWSKGDVAPETDGGPFVFNLSYANAVVKVSLKVSDSDTDGLAALPLKSVMLYSKGAALSGAFSLDYSTGVVTPDSSASDYVKVSLDSPKALDGTQEVWMSVLPVSEAKDFYVVVELGNDVKTVTIPVLFSGKTLVSGRVAAINISDLSLASNACAWYEPVETRLLAGGYSYGDANTFVVKETQVSGDLDVKARGDFRNVSEPKYLALEFTHFNDATKSNQVYINGTVASAATDHYNAANSWTGYKTWEVASDYTFNIRIQAPGWFSPMYSNFVVVVLKDKDLNDLWAFNVWGVYSNSYPVGEIPVAVGSDTYYIQDRNLLSAPYSELNGNASRASIYFQWGRPFTHMWSSNFALPVTSECNDFKYSATNWMHILAYGSATSHMDWFLPERHDDLWGNPNEGSHPNANDGEKTIFDPCPKGYMVISPKVAEAIAGSIDFTTTTVGSNTHRWARYCYDGTNYTYFPYSGLKWANTGGNPSNNYNTYGGFWTNSSYETGNIRAATCYWNASGVRQGAGQSRALSLPVRCMKDPVSR